VTNLGFGAGLLANVGDACRCPMNVYEDGDCVFLFGFSRGGERGRIEIHDAQGRITILKSPTLIASQELLGIRRLKRSKPQPLSKISWVELPAERERLKMAPSDEMQFAAFFEVPSQQPCIIEAVLLRRKIFMRWMKTKMGQWRATCVSLPTASTK
jgi:hypothetical protein